MKLLRPCAAIFFVCAFVGSIDAENTFLGPIPVQYAHPDTEVALDMHRFFQPAGAKLEVSGKKGIDVAYDLQTLQLHLRAKETGICDIPLTAKSDKESHTTVLTLAVTPSQSTHHFIFKPKRGEAAVPAGEKKPDKNASGPGASPTPQKILFSRHLQR